MKLSNKILLGFFGFIFLYLTAVFVEVRLTGISNVLTDENSIAESVELSGMTYLVLNDVDAQVNVVGSDQSSLEVRSIKGDKLKNLTYKVTGDTVVLSGFKSEDRERVKITVFVSNVKFVGLSVIETAVSVQQLQQENLNISENSARIWMDKNKISKLAIELYNSSFINYSGEKIDTLSAKVDKSEVHISSPIHVLQGSIQNGASMELNNALEVQLKRDESSRLSIH